jgi:A/G-specific adenine glycosylase
LDAAAIRKQLARWYERNARELPWRLTRDPYAIWVSEIMLQQTRVAAAIPHYHRFLAQFPDAATLARASEVEVLTAWSGLGYYSRARNLRKAAQEIVAHREFPSDYQSIRELAGVGDYTAAAVASIAFGLPHAVVDGNVRRVIARLTNDGAVRVQEAADRLLDRRNPARSNQALMELGAVVCLPRQPLCGECPVARHCEARRHGTQAELPVKKARAEVQRIRVVILAIYRRGKILLTPSQRVRGFWDLPEPFPGAQASAECTTFRHSIMNTQYVFEVHEAIADRAPEGARWCDEAGLREIPLSTTARKALSCLTKPRLTKSSLGAVGERGR